MIHIKTRVVRDGAFKGKKCAVCKKRAYAKIKVGNIFSSYFCIEHNQITKSLLVDGVKATRMRFS